MPLSTDPARSLHRAPVRLLGMGAVVLVMAACASGRKPASAPLPSGEHMPAAATAGASAGASSAGTVASSGSAPSAGAKPPGAAAQQGPAPPAAVPPRANADLTRAVGFLRSGNLTEAELELKQMTLAYPQLSAPYVNLGILYRKQGRLDLSEDALQSAVQRNGASAVALTELGATQRLRGKFPDAAASYERAIAADPNFAPAYRNLGVVCDLYLGDPERALTALEHYKQLTGEERPVTSWIAELRQRTGKGPSKPSAPAPSSGATDGASGDGSQAPAAVSAGSTPKAGDWL